MKESGHFDDILKYINSETQDSKLANAVVNSLRSGSMDTFTKFLNDEDFLAKCTDLSPSEYYDEEWRKRGKINVAIQNRHLYFELVFSKTKDTVNIITAYPTRKKKTNGIYYTIIC